MNIKTTTIGDEFRDKVANLIRSVKKVTVDTERRLSGKKADVYYEEKVAYQKFPKKIAIECKNYKKSLRASEIRNIISEYRPSKNGASLDTLLIIQKHPTSDGLEVLDAEDWVFWLSYDQLFFNLIDFRSYVDDLKVIDSKFGVSQYHIRPKNSDSKDVEALIDSWISDESDKNPIAILAEYGMGKTSLAHRIARKHASMFSCGESARIPIFIKLGDIVEASSIQSLVSTLFTAEYEIDNFTYSKFEALNSSGHFILIYDGFDEMKHAMSESDFIKMFSQLNALVAGKAKVLLLGRPNAFLSDDEKNRVLHGYQKIGQHTITNHSSPNYREIRLAPFSHKDVIDFSTKYMTYIQKNSSNLIESARTEAFIARRVEEIASDNHFELVRRPVHAKMLADLAMSTDVPINSFTRYQLYDHFTSQFFDRELDKGARVKVTVGERLKFLKHVSVLLWQQNRRAFNKTEFTNSRLIPFLDEKNSSHPGSELIREFVVGSMLVTEKSHGTYYFSHRSFQEYLVASELLSVDVWSTRNIAKYRYCFTTEILSFVDESGDAWRFMEGLFQFLPDYEGYLPAPLLAYLVKGIEQNINPSFGGPVVWAQQDKFPLSPWFTFLVGFKFSLHLPSGDYKVLDKLSFDDDTNKILSHVYGVLVPMYLEFNLDPKVVVYAVAVLHVLCQREMSDFKARGARSKRPRAGSVLVSSSERYSALKLLIDSISVHLDRSGEIRGFTVDVSRMISQVSKVLSPIISISQDSESHQDAGIDQVDRASSISLSISDIVGLISFGTDESRTEFRKNILQFWRSKPDMGIFVYHGKRK